MSTIALLAADGAAPAIETKPRSTFFQRLVKARQKDAMRRIHTFLMTQSDERLKDLGYTSEDIVELRKGKTRMPR
jgi:hypothetical protein